MIINKSNSNKYKIIGERSLDGTHYFVVSGRNLDNIRSVLELQDKIGYPVQMMGMKDEVWIQASKSDKANLLNALNENNCVNE